MIKASFLTMQKRLIHYREIIKVLLLDWLRYEYYMRNTRSEYLGLKNRTELLGKSPISKGYVCLWPYTSRLHAPLIWPYLGKKLLRHCIRSEPFQSNSIRKKDDSIELSILIGHRGMERLPLLLCTLGYIAAQRNAKIECLVVEQDNKIRIKDHLPSWVNYHYQAVENTHSGYNRSAAFNYAARFAKGRILLLHDNDMIIPISYCEQIVSIVKDGFDVVNPKRFVFYLSKESTDSIIKSGGKLEICSPEYIIQNLEAGGSMAITKKGYEEIGGMDEDFIGWGGEDNEFWWRCAYLKRWIWGYSPVIHLWHENQPLKGVSDNKNLILARDATLGKREERIKLLRRKNFTGRKINE